MSAHGLDHDEDQMMRQFSPYPMAGVEQGKVPYDTFKSQFERFGDTKKCMHNFFTYLWPVPKGSTASCISPQSQRPCRGAVQTSGHSLHYW